MCQGTTSFSSSFFACKVKTSRLALTSHDKVWQGDHEATLLKYVLQVPPSVLSGIDPTHGRSIVAKSLPFRLLFSKCFRLWDIKSLSRVWDGRGGGGTIRNQPANLHQNQRFSFPQKKNGRNGLSHGFPKNKSASADSRQMKVKPSRVYEGD